MEDMERVLSGCLLVVDVQACIDVHGGRRKRENKKCGSRRRESKSWRRTRGVLLAISGEIEDVGVRATIEPKGELFEAEVAWSELRRAESKGEEGR